MTATPPVRLHRLRVRWAAIGAAVAVSVGSLGFGMQQFASAEISRGDRPVFVPVTPCRLLDTRPNTNVGVQNGPVSADETIVITAHGENGDCGEGSSIPTSATGVSLNVTAVGATAPTFLSIWGADENPGTSSLNPTPGAPPTPNAVNTPLSDTGTFNLFNAFGEVNVIVDVNGYYAPHNHDDRYVQIAEEFFLSGGLFITRETTTEISNSGAAINFETTSSKCVNAVVPFNRDGPLESVVLRFLAGEEFTVQSALNGFDVDADNALDPDATTTAADLDPTVVPVAGAAGDIREIALTISESIKGDEWSYLVEVCVDGKMSFIGADIEFDDGD